MAPSAEMPITGEVTAIVKVNLRQGAPSVRAPVLRKLGAQTTIPVVALAVGDNVQGNPHWYRTSDNAYAWAGAFSSLEVTDSTPVPAPITPSDPNVNLNKIPLVVDLFHGDGVASFDQAYAAGLRGIIHKATTGTSGVDDAYASRRTEALKAGLLWGAYHWGTAASVSDQVSNFLRIADPDPKTTLVALDFETDVGNQMTLEGAREFLGLISDRLNRKAILYSGDVAKAALGKKNDPFFGSHRLWLAQYNNTPSVQRSWKTYWLWQYTDGSANTPGRKTVPGIPGDRSNRLDCNYFAGTADDLKSQWAS